MKNIILTSLAKAVGVSQQEVSLDIPSTFGHGDFTTNVAMRLYSRNKKGHPTPRAYAENIADLLRKDKKLMQSVANIDVAGSGFINIILKDDTLVNNLRQIVIQKEKFGKLETKKHTKIIFEFGQPNTHKLPHIGHLFSYIYGSAASNLLSNAGYIVRRVNYQGDIGLNVAKCLWAYQKNNPPDPKDPEKRVQILQSFYQEGSRLYEEDPRIKEQIDQVNRAIYDHQPEIEKIWLETRSWSVRYYKDFESRLKINFDRSYFESEVFLQGVKIVEANLGSVFQKSRGAIIFPGHKYQLHDRVFINKNGDPTYEAKDLALAHLKVKEWPADKLIVTTANEQNDYFKVLIKSLTLVNPDLGKKMMHIGFGMVDLVGKKMSSRRGEYIGAVELTDRVIGEVKKIVAKRNDIGTKEIETISQAVGLAAVKFSFLKNNHAQNIKFDINESISLEGFSGPYLQYTTVRCLSVINKARTAETGLKTAEKAADGVWSQKDLNSDELAILRTLIYYPEIVFKAAEVYAPNLVCEYLYQLAQKFNHFYSQNKIIGSQNEPFRLDLCRGVYFVLLNGLALLGISVPEKM